MPYVNFIHEFNAFMRYSRDNKLPGSERNLWQALFYILSRQAEGAMWPDHAIPIDNREVMLNSSLSEKTMSAARGRLKERGLIEYEPGVKNKRNPYYRINYLTTSRVSYPQEYPQNTEGYPQNAGNMGGNAVGKTGGNVGGNVGNISVNLTVEGGNNRLQHQGARDDALRKIIRDMPGSQQMQMQWLSRMDNHPETLMEYAEMLISGQYSRDQLREAMTLVEDKFTRKKIDNPFGYLKKLLFDWDRHDVRTTEEIEGYLAYTPEPSSPFADLLFDAEKGGLY